MDQQTGKPRATTRRSFIELVGGGAVFAAAPTLAGCGDDPAEVQRVRTPDARDPRRFILAHALLAPNPHNRQPWLVDLRRQGEIVLQCDGARLLPDTDPFGRQILIGCGAFVELAVIAAAELGLRVDVQPFPGGAPAGDQLPAGATAARLVLTRDDSVQRDPLFLQIRARHTNKGAYDSERQIGAAQWQQFSATAQAFGLLCGHVNEPARVASARAITRAAYETESVTPRTWLESARLMRIGPREIAAHRDGISIPSKTLWLLSSVGLFDRYEVPVRGTSGFSDVMDYWAPFETGSGYFWIASRGNSRRAQFGSGRAYVRAHLQATAAGIDMHPLSQSLQEFTEVHAQRLQIHRLLGLEPAEVTLQMFARVGYGRVNAPAAPRRGLDPLLATA